MKLLPVVLVLLMPFVAIPPLNAAPRTPAMFAVFTLAYAFSNGTMYASFAAVMLFGTAVLLAYAGVRAAAAKQSPIR